MTSSQENQLNISLDEKPNLFNKEYYERFVSEEDSFFDKIPAIIDYLTYIDCEINEETGEESWYRKRLTPHQKELYRIIKQKAGEVNKAWATGQTYADQIGCSNKTVVKGKRALLQAFEQLDGLSLIDLQIKRTRTRKKEGPGYINSKEIHDISIIDIWPYNNAFATLKNKSFPKMREKITKEAAELAIEKMRQGSLSDNKCEIVHIHGQSVVGNPGKGAECSWNKKSQGRKKGRSVVVPPKHTPSSYPSVKDTYSNVSDVQLAFLNLNLFESFSTEEGAIKWLQGIGVNHGCFKQLNIANNLRKLELAATYCRHMKEKGAPIKSLPAYFMDSYTNSRYNNLF